MEKFFEKIKTDLDKAISDLYLPKITNKHLSHLVLFHLLNAATEYDIPVETLTIREVSQKVYYIKINQSESAITLNLNPTASCSL